MARRGVGSSLRLPLLSIGILVFAFSSSAFLLPAREEVVPPVPITLAELVEKMVADAAQIPDDQLYYVRYLTLHNFEPGREREDATRVLSKHLNDLSSEPDIVIPDVVPGTQGALLRVNFQFYDTRWRNLWERLATFEPYLNVPSQAETVQTVKVKRKWYVEQTPQGEVWYTRIDGKRVNWSEPWPYGDWHYEEVVQPVRKPVRALSPEMTYSRTPQQSQQRGRALAGLVERMKTVAPLFYADWFFRFTAVQDDDRFPGQGVPGYYDFIGVGTKQEDFEKLIAADLDTARFTFKAELSAIVARSRVTHNNRRMGRVEKLGGAYWFTIDSRTNTGKANVIHNPDDLDVARNGLKNITGKKGFAQIAASKLIDFQATEQLGHSPNGLLKWWLANNKGERQNSAPDFIAGDSTAPGTDKRVLINLSCNRCHVEGIHPITDWIRSVATNPLQVQPTNLDFALRQRQLYLSDLGDAVATDQLRYRKALWKATCLPGKADGLEAVKFNPLYRWMWKQYQEDDFELDRIARRLGTTREAAIIALDSVAKKIGGLDPVLGGLLRAVAAEKKEVGIRSEHLEEVYPVLAATARGYVLTP
jgi:hypothetical protein